MQVSYNTKRGFYFIAKGAGSMSNGIDVEPLPRCSFNKICYKYTILEHGLTTSVIYYLFLVKWARPDIHSQVVQ